MHQGMPEAFTAVSLLSNPWVTAPPPCSSRGKDSVLSKQSTAGDFSDRSTAAPDGGSETPDQDESCDDEAIKRVRQIWSDLRSGESPTPRLATTSPSSAACGGQPFRTQRNGKSACGVIARPAASAAQVATAAARSAPPPLLAHSMALAAKEQAQAQAQVERTSEGSLDSWQAATKESEVRAAIGINTMPRSSLQEQLQTLPGFPESSESPYGHPPGLPRAGLRESKAELCDEEVAMRAAQAWQDLHGAGQASLLGPPSIANVPPTAPPPLPAAPPPLSDFSSSQFMPPSWMPKMPPMMPRFEAASGFAGTPQASPPAGMLLLGTRPVNEACGASIGIPLYRRAMEKDPLFTGDDEVFSARKNGNATSPMYVHVTQSSLTSNLDKLPVG